LTYSEKQGKGMILPSDELFKCVFMITFWVQQTFSSEQHQEYKIFITK